MQNVTSFSLKSPLSRGLLHSVFDFSEACNGSKPIGKGGFLPPCGVNIAFSGTQHQQVVAAEGYCEKFGNKIVQAGVEYDVGLRRLFNVAFFQRPLASLGGGWESAKEEIKYAP
jgi:hypothetical protein